MKQTLARIKHPNYPVLVGEELAGLIIYAVLKELRKVIESEKVDNPLADDAAAIKIKHGNAKLDAVLEKVNKWGLE